jgi:NADPH:quinone reductase-like Zn-dependent oxidoreductase
MEHWDFLVERADLSQTELRPIPAPDMVELAAGEALVQVERFSFTANNITYGVVGDQLGYWRFFPAPDKWGRIPVWGFARVLRSEAVGVSEGLRLYGYLPMSTHFVTSIHPYGGGYVDASAHRAALPAAYNRYVDAPVSEQDDHLALLKPLFTTSFLLDDMLDEAAPSATVIISSASSRTALGLASMVARRGAKAVALTSDKNIAFLENLGLYGQVVRYQDVSQLDVNGSVAFVDVAGDTAVRAAVHHRFGARLVHSAVVGATHHEARAPAMDKPLPGPPPVFFFAPDRLAKRSADWGASAFNDRVRNEMSRFIDESAWLRIEHHRGPDALGKVYGSALKGTASPSVGYIVLP